jgi:polysaccharide pyruvyl transferase WcaK-like protein
LSRAAFKQAWTEPSPEPPAEGAFEPETSMNEASQGPATGARGIRIRVGAIIRSIARLLLPKGWPWAIRTEVQQTLGAYRLLQSTDMVILSGGGQLDGLHGGPWKHPYALAKWAVLAKLTGTRFVGLSIGFGSLDSFASRFFARLAWRLSDYRSYRDPGSKELMDQIGFRRDDPVFPDLAFSLDVSSIRVASADDRRKRVCISPMVYSDPERWPTGDVSVHSRYLSALTDVAEQLIRSDFELVLVASDGPDKHTVERLRDGLSKRIDQPLFDKIEVPVVDTVDEFLEQAARCEILIATRLHGVVLSHLVGTPALAISYDRKVEEHMRVIGQSQYCIDVADFDPDRALKRVHDLMANAEEERLSILRKGQEFRKRLDRQYDRVLGTRLDS